jgi:site-specific recombinase XerD
VTGVLPAPATSSALAVVVHAPGGVSMALPPVISDAGEAAARLTLEFFTARIPNPHTRKAYGRAVFRFCAWCQARGVSLHELAPTTLAAYLEERQAAVSTASVKLAASAVRHWLDYLTERGALPSNPARSVRTVRLVVTEGKTPVLEREDAKKLFASLSGPDAGPRELRDRAMFGVMLFAWLRVGAIVRMTVRDFEDEGAEAWLVVHEKGGKERRIPCHADARAYLRAYIAWAGFEPRSRVPLFQSMPARRAKLSGLPLMTGNVLEAVKRRCRAAGLPSSVSCHSFRAGAITMHAEGGGRLEDAQELAGHADARTTRLYVRKRRTIQRREVDRVQL